MNKEKAIILQNRYRVLYEIGRGGMGAVYVCADLRLKCRVALKRMLATAEFESKRFEKEANLLANLQHPNLPKVTDFFSEKGHYFLVMEFIDGTDLEDLMEQQQKPFEIERIELWLQQLVDALQYLHSHVPPIIHRDIKPSNIKLTENGRLFLLDFGLAHGHAGLMKSQFSFSAPGFTPNFACLEQIQGNAADPSADIFSLGATLYYLLSGTPPVNAVYRVSEIMKGKADPIVDLSKIIQVPQQRCQLIHSCMALNPSERPQSIKEFQERWCKVEKEKAQLSPVKTVKQKANFKARFAFFLLVAAIAWFSFNQIKKSNSQTLGRSYNSNTLPTTEENIPFAIAKKTIIDSMIEHPVFDSTDYYLYNKKDTAAALCFVNRVLEIQPRENDFLKKRAIIYSAQGKTVEAIADLNSVSPDSKYDTLWLLIMKGRLWQSMGVDVKAKSYYEAYLSQDSLSSDIYFELGKCHISDRNPEAALYCFNKSLALNPTSLETYASKGFLLHQSGNDEAAAQVFATLRLIDRNYFDSLVDSLDFIWNYGLSLPIVERKEIYGRYSGQGKYYERGLLEVSNIGEGTYIFELYVSNRKGFTGELKGKGLFLTDSLGVYHEECKENCLSKYCDLVFLFGYDTIMVEEISCANYHGAGIEFTGVFTRQIEH